MAAPRTNRSASFPKLLPPALAAQPSTGPPPTPQIAINLNGYTKGARNEIFALEPAPVQVGWALGPLWGCCRCLVGGCHLWAAQSCCRAAFALATSRACPTPPPPLQASYLGFPATTGAPFLPWLILDQVRP